MSRPGLPADLEPSSSGSNWDAERDISQTATQDLITHTHGSTICWDTVFTPDDWTKAVKPHAVAMSWLSVRTFLKSGHFIHSRPAEVSVTQHQRRSTRTENRRWKPLRNRNANKHFSMNRFNRGEVAVKLVTLTLLSTSIIVEVCAWKELFQWGCVSFKNRKSFFLEPFLDIWLLCWWINQEMREW